MRKYKNQKLCDFDKIPGLDIPRVKLLRILFRDGKYNKEEETIFLKQLDWKLEAREYQIQHVRSLVRIGLLKSR